MKKNTLSANQDIARLKSEYASREQLLANSSPYTPFSQGDLFIIQQRQRAVLRMLRAFNKRILPLSENRILELGCGSGGVLHEFIGYGANPNLLYGTDLLPGRVREAAATLPRLPLSVSDGRFLPYPDHVFDLALQFTAFSSVLSQSAKQSMAAEMLRVLKPDGLILWYDFWLNPTNPETRGIRMSEIKKLFPNCRYTHAKITLAPPIARRLAPYSWPLCHLLESLRIFNTHHLVIISTD